MRKALLVPILVGLLALSHPAPASALFDIGEIEGVEEIMLMVNEVRHFEAQEPTRVVIGNPAVADVAEVTETDIVVNAKADGTTTFVYWDKFGEHSFRLKVFSVDLDQVNARIKRVLADTGFSEVQTKINEDERKVFLSGQVVNEAEKEKLDYVLGDLKQYVVNTVITEESKTSIEIDVQILELTIDDADNLGVGWTLQPLTTVTENPFEGIATEPLSHRVAEAFRIGYLTRTDVTAALNMYIKRGKGRVLSRPKLVCLSGKEAEFLVGGEVPIVTTSTLGENFTTNVEYRDIGISLKIKPTYTKSEAIITQLTMEVSEINTANSVTAGGINIPGFDTRKAESELYLKDGQTVFLAGLIKNKDSDTLTKWPALGDVPVLGALFRSKSFTNNQTELVITLTPHVIKEEDIGNLSLRKGGMSRQRSDASFEADIVSPSYFLGNENVYKYVKAVQTKISRSVYYPKVARDAGWEGVVKLSLRILRNGRLGDIKLTESSGYKIIDDASISVAKAQSPYPPFPPQIQDGELWVDVPIVYKRR
ncbi:MAG: TonB family protein [Candidatus Omnitrophica bacterium]|nr:TonB family protein [Candidatus Omnitrophota bacterium]